jgi:hypothetical protein
MDPGILLIVKSMIFRGPPLGMSVEEGLKKFKINLVTMWRSAPLTSAKYFARSRTVWSFHLESRERGLCFSPPATLLLSFKFKLDEQPWKINRPRATVETSRLLRLAMPSTQIYWIYHSGNIKPCSSSALENHTNSIFFKVTIWVTSGLSYEPHIFSLLDPASTSELAFLKWWVEKFRFDNS